MMWRNHLFSSSINTYLCYWFICMQHFVTTNVDESYTFSGLPKLLLCPLCQIWFSTHFHKYFSSQCITSSVLWMNKPCIIILQQSYSNSRIQTIEEQVQVVSCMDVQLIFLKIIIKTKKSKIEIQCFGWGNLLPNMGVWTWC